MNFTILYLYTCADNLIAYRHPDTLHEPELRKLFSSLCLLCHADLFFKLSDVFMTVTILSNTLMSGTPLPASFPKLRDRLVYHGHLHGGHRFGISPQRNLKPMSGKPAAANDDSSSESIDNVKDMPSGDNAAGLSNVDGSSMGFEDDEVTLDLLMVHKVSLIYSSNVLNVGLAE